MVSSCGTATRIYSNVLDYRSYTENGFFISPNPYPEAHQTIGEITITVYPGTKGRSLAKYFNTKNIDSAIHCIRQEVKTHH